MFTDEKPHRRYGDAWGVAFWKDNAASDADNANRAVLYCGPPGMPYPEFKFEWPAQKYEMEQLERALGKVFEAGRHAAKKEIRDVLGVVERR